MKYLKHKPGSIEEIAAKMKPEDSDYQAKFKKELDKAGKGIASMTDKEKKDFFNKIDKMHKAKNEMTAAQKKLPPALQKAIKDKEQKEELDKALKEKDSYGNEINKAKHAAYKDPKAGEHKPVDPKPSLKSVAKTVKEMMRKKKDDVAPVADTEKDKEKKTTLVGSKKTPVDTKPEVEYKN